MRKFLLYINICALLFLLAFGESYPQKSESRIKLARVKYSGGGDWYNDASAEVNLLKYVAKMTNIPVSPIYEYVDLATDNLFLYPIIFLTGHGNINFTDAEVIRLRAYLQNGGFLYIDDDYGLDEFIRKEMKKVFPEQKFVELPFTHPIYSSYFNFGNGLPKIHEHDDKSPQGFAMFNEGRLCVFYTFESNLGDGWPDPEIHGDTPEAREKAFQMGVNIIVYALSQ